MEGEDKWARLIWSNLNLLTQNRGKPYHPSPGLYSTLHAPFTSFAPALPLNAKGTNISANLAEVKPAEELTVFCQVTDKISSSNGQLCNRMQHKRRSSSALTQAKRKCWKQLSIILLAFRTLTSSSSFYSMSHYRSSKVLQYNIKRGNFQNKTISEAVLL